MAESRSTAPQDVTVRQLNAARLLRRLFFVLICAILLAALLGRLGVHSKTVEATGGGYGMTVSYDDITRGGLAATFDVEIRRPGGFRDEVSVSVSSAYFAFFDQNDLSPEPIRTTGTDEIETFTFEPPPGGDTMTVSLDARVQPGIQLERIKGTVALLEAGQEVVSVRISTLVLP